MSLISLDYLCPECRHRHWETVPRDIQFSYTPECAQCGAEMRRVPSAPRVMRASYPDGTNRFKDLKESIQLEMEMADLPATERSKIKQEIKQLGGNTND